MKTHLRLFIAFCALGALIVPGMAAASPVLRSGETIEITDQQEVVGNFYAAAATLHIDGAIRGDLHAAAGTVRISGTVEDDAVIAGGTVHIDGAVGDDVRVFAGELSISGTVGGNIMVLGGSVRVLSDARVAGDILMLGGDIDISGSVEGSVVGRADTVRIHGGVGGDISASARRTFELGDRAHVDGSISYQAPRELVRAPGSVVVGEITRTPVPVGGSRTFSIIPLLVLLFTSLVYAYLFRSKLSYFAPYALSSFGFHGIIGLLALIAAPFISILLMLSVIGMPVGVALALFALLVFTIAWSLGGVLVGAAIARYAEGTPAVSVKWVLLGALAFGLVSYIPYIGVLAATLVVLISAGALLRLAAATMRG